MYILIGYGDFLFSKTSLTVLGPTQHLPVGTGETFPRGKEAGA